jgi:hypothetical protein
MGFDDEEEVVITLERMVKLFDAGRGTSTPWGKADSVTNFGNGLKFYTTPSHGGFHVAKSLFNRIPIKHREYAERWVRGLKGWFEEDCAWAFLAIDLPEFFHEEERLAAMEVINWLDKEGHA